MQTWSEGYTPGGLEALRMDHWEAFIRGKWCGHRHARACEALECGRAAGVPAIVENRNPRGWLRRRGA